MFLWQLIDINECEEVAGICTNGDCRNLDGSFSCICKPGFRLASSKDSCLGRLIRTLTYLWNHWHASIVQCSTNGVMCNAIDANGTNDSDRSLQIIQTTVSIGITNT